MTVHRNVRDHARMTLWIFLAAISGTFAFASLTESRSYLIVGFVSAGLVCLVGFGMRVVRMPWPLTMAVQVVVLFWWTVLTYANDSLAFIVFPTRATLSELNAIIVDTFDHAQQFAPPVPESPSLHALLAVSVGVLAIIIDLLAGSLRLAPAVGLVFLAVYMMPVALLSGEVSLWYFLPGALAFVFLLAAQERSSIARWGRNVSYASSEELGQTHGIYSSGLASAGRRVGFGAVALAVVLPVLIPTFSTNLFGEGGIAGRPGGSGGRGDVDVGKPFLDMRRNLLGQSSQELLRITSTTTPQYVRLAALDSLDTAGWEVSDRGPKTEDVDGVLPAPRGVDAEVERATSTFTVKVTENFESQWLPTIYWPTSIGKVKGNWLIDAEQLDVVAEDDDTNANGMEYQLNVSKPYPTPEQLRKAGPRVPGVLEPLTELPDSTPPSVETRARELTRGIDNPFEQAVAIQNWFRRAGNFTYTLEPADSGNGMETIENFLTDERQGYCEQFASAMAMMARSLGIPARVAVGFLSGERNDDTYVFRGTDMHAWPELYLDGVGWVRFEPTPGQRTGAPPAFGSNLDESDDSTMPQDGQTNSRTPPGETDSRSANLDKAAAANDGGGAGGGSSFPWRWLVGVGAFALAVAALGGVPRWIRSRRRQHRWAAATDPHRAAEAAWDELRDTVVDLRMPWPTGATPRATGRRLRPMVHSRERAVEALNRIVLAVERSRYAQSSAAEDLRADVELLTQTLASRVTTHTRRKATWLPVSLLGGLRPRRRKAEGGRTAHTELLALEE